MASSFILILVAKKSTQQQNAFLYDTHFTVLTPISVLRPNGASSPKSERNVIHLSPWGGGGGSLSSAICCSPNNECLSQVNNVTFTYGDTQKKKNQSGDWSVQIRVDSCGSHVTGFNFAQHTRVLPRGGSGGGLRAACKNRDTWPF